VAFSNALRIERERKRGIEIEIERGKESSLKTMFPYMVARFPYRLILFTLVIVGHFT